MFWGDGENFSKKLFSLLPFAAEFFPNPPQGGGSLIKKKKNKPPIEIPKAFSPG